MNRKNIALFLLAGFVAGFVWLAGIRFIVAQPEETHYHANLAVYINGVREEFALPTYYEEIAACSSEYANNPKGRVHMHEQINDVIHVHDKRVTYGNFFNNIGWGIGSKYISTIDRLYEENDDNKLTFILNGEEVDSITNRVIGNLDKLLVSFGDESDEEINDQFESVSSSAEEKNKYQDPSSCGGLNGKGYDSLGSKLKRATFWP